MQRTSHLLPLPPSPARRVPVAQRNLLTLARAWLRSEHQYAAAARLRVVAPDPLPQPDPIALAAALGLRPRDAFDRATLLDGLGRAGRTSTDARVSHALADAVDCVMETIDP